MYICRTITNRAIKRKKIEPGSAEPENVDPKVNEDVKPKIHELPPSAKKPTKYTRKHGDNMMTKEVIASLLAYKDDEFDVTLSGYAKRIKKSLSAEAQEDCIMEMGEVLNKYIHDSHHKLAPTSTISSPPPSNNVIPIQPNLDGMRQQNYSSMPPLMKMGGFGEVIRDSNMTYYNM